MSVIRLTKEFTFEAAHMLEGYDGLCREVKIAELEKLEPEMEEISRTLALICRQNNLTMEQLKEYYTPEFEEAVMTSVLTSKVMRLIRDAAVVEEK